MLNLFIAVVCSAMESEVHDRPPAADPAVLGELRALREEVRALAAERAPSVGPAERLHPVGSAERGASN